jgi:Photoprotection regulator fluorescence recovery protein
MVYDEWTKHEKKVAHEAFEKALTREKEQFVGKVRARAAGIRNIDDVWRLEADIHKKARSIDERYDYRYSVLIYVFAGLIREGWISMDDLAELGDDKRKKIDMLLRIADQ